jgi:uncharacterized OsmC-like protein
MATATFTTSLGKTRVSKIHSISLGGQRSTEVCPPNMVKDYPEATSPHHLFLASIGACVTLVFEIALEKAHIELIDLKSEISGDYETDEETGVSKFAAVHIFTKATLPEGVPEAKIQRLYEVAHTNCPIGNCLVGSCVKLITDLEITYK